MRDTTPVYKPFQALQRRFEQEVWGQTNKELRDVLV